MRTEGPSLTAWSAARYRATHQVADGASIFSDPLVQPLLGLTDEELLDGADEDRARRMRMFIASRSRLAEDLIAATGVAQVVVLGAGLDTYAYRHPGARVFEVDHPATAAWKQERLIAARIDVPSEMVRITVDFEHEDLFTALTDGGVDPGEPAFFVWLGVLPYLTREAIDATFRTVARIPGSHLVFDYGVPTDPAHPESGIRAERMARAASIGEPWITFLEPAELARLLHTAGLEVARDVDVASYIRDLFGMPPGGRASSARLAHAVTAPA